MKFKIKMHALFNIESDVPCFTCIDVCLQHCSNVMMVYVVDTSIVV